MAKELLPKRPATVRIARTPDSLALDLETLAGSWYGVLEPSGEVAAFAISDVVGGGRRAMFSTVSGWRRGGFYDFSPGAGDVTFRLPGRGTVVVGGTTLTWTPETGSNSQTATLTPLSED